MPRLVFARNDDIPWQEVRAQRNGERRVSVHEKFLQWNDQRLILYARYDPGVIVERHGHKSDHVIYITQGDVMVGDTHCPAGTTIVLEQGAFFGPLVAGEQGAEMFEIFWGDPSPVSENEAAFTEMLHAKGIEPLPHPSIYRPEGTKD
ncbi:MAG: hypothetical protein V3V35_05100 [Dehalococcoidia bacterium]